MHPVFAWEYEPQIGKTDHMTWCDSHVVSNYHGKPADDLCQSTIITPHYGTLQSMASVVCCASWSWFEIAGRMGSYLRSTECCFVETENYPHGPMENVSAIMHHQHWPLIHLTLSKQWINMPDISPQQRTCPHHDGEQGHWLCEGGT